jgi:hypothetical protein
LATKFRRLFRIEKGVLDFYCFEHRLAIELDGGAHSEIDQTRKDAVKGDCSRALGIRPLRVPNARVREHLDEFGREMLEAIRASVDKARKGPLTRPAPAGENAGCRTPSPLGEVKGCSERIRACQGARRAAAARRLSFPSPREKVDRDGRSHQPSLAAGPTFCWSWG